MGLDAGSLDIMAIGGGSTRLLRESGRQQSFRSFKDLLAQPQQSRQALLSLLDRAARRVVKGLRHVEDVHFIVPALLPHEPLRVRLGSASAEAEAPASCCREGM